MNGPVEILIEGDHGVFLDNGEGWQGLRVRYRVVGVRRWEKFILVGADDQTLRDLLTAAVAVVHRADAGPVGHLETPLQLDVGARA